MITHVEADRRFKAQNEWLTSYHLFSFAEYYDPQNMNFGGLRVFNDDEIGSDAGFGEHAHDNMEIVTIVLDGELSHTDSLGNTGIIRAGEVQYMSAGTGVRHAELNEGFDHVRLFQIWVAPREQSLVPKYDQKDFSDISNTNILLPVVSGDARAGAITIQADATIYTSLLLEGKTIEYALGKNHGLFIYSKLGVLTVNGFEMQPHDQMRITDESIVSIFAQEDAEFIAIDVSI